MTNKSSRDVEPLNSFHVFKGNREKKHFANHTLVLMSDLTE